MATHVICFFSFSLFVSRPRSFLDLRFYSLFRLCANRFIVSCLGRSAKNPLPRYESFLKNIRMRRNMFSTYLHNMIAKHSCRSHWAKAHRAQVASPTTVSIWVNSRNEPQMWHHHDSSSQDMSVSLTQSLLKLVLENLVITFVAYSVRWLGVVFCYIKTGRSSFGPELR